MDAIMVRLARLMALLGGTVFCLLVALTCLSVLGRTLDTIGHSEFIKDNLGFLSGILVFFGPVNGDFELVEAGVAFAIMACIPWCQLNRAHATVELFTNFFPHAANRFLAFVWEVLFAFVWLVVAWRLYVGTSDKMRYGETTFMLQYPVWWGYAACCAAAIVACVIALYSVWLHWIDMRNTSASSFRSAHSE
ncbi:MAG: TRAP transporter small permease [Pseudomonadota bacterium]